MDDPLTKYLKLIALVLFIVIGMLWLLSLSCMAGYCSTHNCGKSKKEGFTGPPMQTMSLGGYNRLCRFGDGGIWFDCSSGAGEYIGTGKSEQGFYEPATDCSDMSGIAQPRTPECMKANCGRFDTPKNVRGCGCLGGPEVCCGKNRGCKANYLPYYATYNCKS